MTESLKNLNQNQSEAVIYTDGPLLILAGAGSGKTRVITNRIAYLIREKGVRPYNIMAVTFTNKAAAEMKARVIKMIGSEANSVFIKTFHSASVYILRRFGEDIGIPSTFSIYDTGDQETLIKEILLEARLDPKKIKPRMIASKISEIKDKPEFFSSGPDSLMPKNLPFNFTEIYRTYHTRMRKLCALDFNDLLIETTRLLRDLPEALSRMQSMWRYYMIDEYQDTNHAQYLICKYLSSASRNLCVVGDDDQSIYSWRGADIRNILNFEKDYVNAKVVKLEDNYRSTSSILDSAYHVIKNNRNRKDKRLKAFRGVGEPVVWCQTNNEYGEAEFIINTILTFKNRDGLKNKDFAIFYRTNAQSRVFEDYLRKENLPYRVVGGLKFYDRKEIKDILSYLKVINNTADTVSLLRVINAPARGIGNATIAALREVANTEGISEWDVINNELPIKGRKPKGITEFKKIIKKGIELAGDIPGKVNLPDLVKEIVETSGYKKVLEDEDSIESRSRVENIDELLNSIYDSIETNDQITLNEFLQDVSLLSSQEDPEELIDESGVITLMTVHIAKGLEFSVVFLTGMEDGIFPHFNSIDTEEGIEEERRLCYVGITRAKDRLFITNAEIRRSYGEIRYKIPSRFIQEIPEEFLERSEYFSGGYSSSSSKNSAYYNKSKSDFISRSLTKTLSSTVDRKTSINNTLSNVSTKVSQFSLKDVVVHPKYGTGTITDIKGSGANVKLVISFGRGQSKTFLQKYTHLEKLN